MNNIPTPEFKAGETVWTDRTDEIAERVIDKVSIESSRDGMQRATEWRVYYTLINEAAGIIVILNGSKNIFRTPGDALEARNHKITP